MTTSPQPAVEAPRRRRPFLRLALVLLAAVLFGVGVLGYLWYTTDRARREAIAEADRLDPGWRLADLEAARAPVRDAENGALQVQAAAALLPKPSSPPPANNSPGLEDEVDQVQPPVRLGGPLSRTLGAEVAKAAPALAPARRLAEMPRGRYAVTWSADAVGTLMPHLEERREVARLLRLDAVLRAHDGDVDGALDSCRAVLNVGRSVGDEPAPVSQLQRLSCQRLAVKSLERTLAQGEASEPALAAVQRALEEEEKEPLQLIARRGERAFIHQFLEVAEARRIDRPGYNIRSATGSYRLDDMLDGGRAHGAHAAYLHYLTELVEIAKLPPEQQAERLRRPGLEPPAHGIKLLEALTEGGKDFGAARFQAHRALLRCAAAGVAAERYRRANGNWPDDLRGLVPDYLAAVPNDPSDGRPLTYWKLADGVMVEAPGVAGERVGTAGTPAPAVAFRLWDAGHRGSTSAAPPSERQ
jgi:hypothetical protein